MSSEKSLTVQELYLEPFNLETSALHRVVTKLVATGQARPALTKTDQH